jgi:2-keto-3-deoxy-L-rhamnonate aldolase RhmA
MALDAGAAGILAPYVESIDEVQALRGAVKYRPLKGARLQRVLAGEETLDAETAAYLARHNAGKLMLINIESAPAMAALDALLAMPDLDGVVIGPHDLSINLGIAEQYTQPRFTEAVTEILGKARARGIAAGYHFGFGLDTAIAWAGLGANLVIHSTDLMLVRDTLRHDLARFREALGEDAQPDAGADGGDVPVV